MKITISISQEHEDEVKDILAWAHGQSWTKSKFICNAIIHYARHLKSEQGGSPLNEKSAATSLLSEDILRRLIREELHEKTSSEQALGSKGSGKKKPALKPAKGKTASKKPVDCPDQVELIEEVQLDIPEPEEPTGMNNAISQEEQELYDLINAGLGIE